MPTWIVHTACGLLVVGLSGWAGAATTQAIAAANSALSTAIAFPPTPFDAIAIPEAPETDDPVERERRAAKAARYDHPNHGSPDLLTLAPGISTGVMACGASAGGPVRLVAGGDVVVLGTVQREQPFLTRSRTSIVTEYSIAIDEVLARDAGELPTIGAHLLVDRPGGVLRMRGGRVVAYDFQGSSVAHPLDVVRRYVLVLRRVNEGTDLTLGQAYELRDGEVYRLWENRHGDRSVADSRALPPAPGRVTAFLDAVRRELAATRSTRR